MRRIALVGKRGKGKFVLVDDDDYEKLNKVKWRLHNGYVETYVYDRKTKKESHISMHRLINNTPKGMLTDHINRNKLDNRKCNLRSCDNHINNFNKGLRSDNKSGQVGVHWNKPARKWLAQIRTHRKAIHLGLFERMEDALEARKKAEMKYYGTHLVRE